MQIVLDSAYSIRETRLQAIATGRIIPGVNDRRSSGLFSGDFSDASSISSTGSGSRFKKLRDTTDMARASLDSLRRGSKESLDDLFKRGLSITRGASEEIDRKRASTGDMTRSLSQKFAFANNLASKVKRTSSVRSVNNTYLSQQNIEDQIQRDWLLANQLNASENTSARHNSISSSASSTNTSSTAKGSSLMNRFSQFVSSKPVVPYHNQTGKSTQNHQDSSLRKTDSTYSSSSVLSNNEDKKQIGTGLNAHETIVGAYRGFV